jgi:hypothetical protein
MQNIRRNYKSRCQCLMPIILVTGEAEVRRMMVRGQPGEIVHQSPISKTARAK